MADSIPYLVPFQFQESIFSPITHPKNLAQNQVKVGEFGLEIWNRGYDMIILYGGACHVSSISNKF